MKIFIIGGTGFIGRHVSLMLAANGHDVTVYHRGNTRLNHPQISEITGDRNNLEQLQAACSRCDPDTVIDTIAFTARHARYLQVMMPQVCHHLVLLSSGDVYRAYGTLQGGGGPIDTTPLTEASPLREKLFPFRPPPGAPYNELAFDYDKIIVEQMAQHAGFDTTILRLPAVFGPGDPHQKLPAYFKPMLAGEPEITISELQASWIFSRSYVENAAHAICLAVTRKAARNQVFNLGDIHITELELITRLKHITGWTGEIVIAPQPDDPTNYGQHLWLSDARLRRCLRYKPLVDADEALQQTVNSYTGGS